MNDKLRNIENAIKSITSMILAIDVFVIGSLIVLAIAIAALFML